MAINTIMRSWPGERGLRSVGDGGKGVNSGGSEEIENRFNASNMAINTIMRSWPGERGLGSVREWGRV